MAQRFALKARDHVGLPDRKRRFNEAHFAEAAPRYDVATRAMSLGRDAAWKRELVAALPDPPSPACVDIACGTGDVAFLLAARYRNGTVTGIDISDGMLRIARARNRFRNLGFASGDLCALPLADGSADLVTASYALRNAPALRPALAEIRRVLAPGGFAAILDFSRPRSPILGTVQIRMLRRWCGLWGSLLHGSSEIHGYIAESLAGFPDRRRFREMLVEEGFSVVSSRRHVLGILERFLLRAPV